LFADNRFEAVTIVREKNIDVVLLSLKDFKREGLIILAEIKDVCPPIEVITISGGDQITLSIEGMKLGVFDDFIVPFEFETLARRMQEALSEKYGKKRAP
jgi:DNA-binding NtrC family response regulator